jgi:hypothetical protein
MREIPTVILQCFGGGRKPPCPDLRRTATAGGPAGNKKAPAKCRGFDGLRTSEIAEDQYFATTVLPKW